MGVAIGTFTQVVTAYSRTGHYRREYRRMQRMRIPEYVIPHETSVSRNLNAVHNEKLDGHPERTTAEPVGAEACAYVLPISHVAERAS
jgi:hypothetical protein